MAVWRRWEPDPVSVNQAFVKTWPGLVRQARDPASHAEAPWVLAKTITPLQLDRLLLQGPATRTGREHAACFPGILPGLKAGNSWHLS
ncbi:MAG: hypothetical protein OXC07_05800 [Kistimonas sp.]|nr:hypothetical protein [Kistimonas sp.]